MRLRLLALLQFPDVVEGIFNSIDAISRDATRILHRPLEENGDSEKLVNGGGGTPVPPGAPCSDYDHHTLQVVSFSFYNSCGHHFRY
uniref:Uncharacterized protein n=1 Tax=Parascaris equorum TaxID=6256 RepID=A0A914R7G2_PAREQ